MKYSILKETAREDGRTLYDVILEADDGYQETQQYIGDLTTLEEATRNLNETHLAQVAELEAAQLPKEEVVVEEPKFVEVPSLPIDPVI